MIVRNLKSQDSYIGSKENLHQKQVILLQVVLHGDPYGKITVDSMFFCKLAIEMGQG